ncbi:MAG: pyruvate, phosphate dikinase [Sarcina sp.]
MTKYIYFFNEGNSKMKDLLGGKGANLAQMTNLNISVPKGFTITTEACNDYYRDGEKINISLLKQIDEAISMLEDSTGKIFGDRNNPLIVSVRSGAKFSMPGMMDTVLNLGLNDVVVDELAKKVKENRFIYDSYRRFIQMFSDVVKGIEKIKFERVLEKIKDEKNYNYDTELTIDDLKNIIEKFKLIYEESVGEEFPKEPKIQLLMAIEAVFKSWNNERAIIYRRVNNIASDLGTAVNIQEMVFGNLGENSGTGVVFSRNPATGEKKLYGEYLMNAQGEDVVAGIRTPKDISELMKDNKEVFTELNEMVLKLEKYFKDMQDIEFTIEDGKLYLLQTRNAKRTVKAGLKVALDLYREGIITKEEVVMSIKPAELSNMLHPTFNFKKGEDDCFIVKGLPASPGAAYGKIVFSKEEAKKRKDENEKTILVRSETSPEDIEGMLTAEGVITVNGGMTSHAAVVARGIGIPCIVGCTDLIIDEENKKVKVGDKIFNQDDYISIDGGTGRVYEGKVETKKSEVSEEFKEFMELVDQIKRMKVKANADNAQDAKIAMEFGAEGIGLCRTEHMFFGEDRIRKIRKMILSTTEEQREKALNELLPVQKKDFEMIYNVMKGKAVTIRLLDPPLHEFLPKDKKEILELAIELEVQINEINEVIETLHEFNPMMGLRGCRLGIIYPEIVRMQTKAIIESSIEVKRKFGYEIEPEIMVPLISDVTELRYIKNIINEVANEIIEKEKININFKVGTMIEIPRAALTADEIAIEAEFFCFGTNDLTQMTLGFSRDDSEKFLGKYFNKGIYKENPFNSIDKSGVGELMKIAVEKGRKAKPNLELGICGEHGGDPVSIEFCDKIGIDYISCSPFRIPIAKLAAAQAEVKNNKLI